MDTDNLSPEAEQLRTKAQKIAEGNMHSFNELREKVPGFDMDTSDARRELLIKFLVEWGIITPEQVFEFEVEFHTQVEASLNEMWEQYRRQQGKQKFTVVQNDKKLLGPNGRPL